MPLVQLGWLFTIGVLAHNAEEALLLPAWSRQAGKWHRPVSDHQFWFAVSVFSAALVILMAAASFSPARSVPAYLITSSAFAVLLNVPAPHLVASIAMRKYMPGTATAVLLNLPLGGAFLHRALTDGYVAPRSFAWCGPLTALFLLASIPVLFALGRRLWPSAA
jgi:hypothetical protein